MRDIRSMIGLLAAVLCLTPAVVRAQSDSDLAHSLRHGTPEQRQHLVMTMLESRRPVMGTQLREALIAVLQEEGVEDLRRQMNRDHGPAPELVAALALLVAEINEPHAIPSLALALGNSPAAAQALARFGPRTAPVIVGVMTSYPTPSVLMDGLLALRLIAENSQPDPQARRLMANAARIHLEAPHHPAVIRRALDLAIALKDPMLRETVVTIANDPEYLRALGIRDETHIAAIQERARARLAGELPLPRLK